MDILARLLPAGGEGGISTLPLSYKPWIAAGDAAALAAIIDNLVRLTARLIRVEEQEGKLIHLDLEPEPDGLLECSREVVEFFQDLAAAPGGPRGWPGPPASPGTKPAAACSGTCGSAWTPATWRWPMRIRPRP